MKNIIVLILGAGGHAKVLLDCLRLRRNISVLGFFDINSNLIGEHILGIPILGNENEIFENYSPSSIQLINGLGSVSLTQSRANIFQKFKKIGYHFLSVVHPNSYLGSDIFLGEGVQLMSGTTIQTGCHIGNNVIVNTHTSIDHDCYIEDHVHLAPGVTCCGNVTIGSGTHVGCGAVIMQGVKIGKNCLIAAGAVVIHDVNVNSKVAGVPAKSME